jgi:hypothetical protein
MKAERKPGGKMEEGYDVTGTGGAGAKSEVFHVGSLRGQAVGNLARAYQKGVFASSPSGIGEDPH